MKAKKLFFDFLLSLFSVVCIFLAITNCDLKKLTLEMVLVGIVGMFAFLELAVVIVNCYTLVSCHKDYNKENPKESCQNHSMPLCYLLKNLFTEFIFLAVSSVLVFGIVTLYPKTKSTPQELCRLGDNYYYGYGVQQNYKNAFRYWQKSAKQGNSKAQFNLGYCYYIGKGVAKNREKAFEWWNKSAGQGEMRAQCILADSCYDLDNEIKDFELSEQWCDNYSPEELYVLGNYYFCGIAGLPQDNEKALFLWEESAKRNCVAANYRLGHCYYNGKIVEKDMINALIYWSNIAWQGSAEAQNCLGYLYFDWLGNSVKAEDWFKKSAEQNNASAQYNLACIYSIQKQESEAFEWWQKVAEQGHAKSMYQVGRCYYFGLGGVEVDYEKAVHWWTISANRGSKLACYGLMLCYKNSNGVPQDDYAAYGWYSKGFELGMQSFSFDESFYPRDIKYLEKPQSEFELDILDKQNWRELKNEN